MEKIFLMLGMVSFAAGTFAESLVVDMLPGEAWFGVYTFMGSQMPITKETKNLHFDLRTDNWANQSAPFFVSTKGRYIWCDTAFEGMIDGGKISLKNSSSPIELAEAGKTLREAFRAAAAKHFPASGKMPDAALFEKPQWNTWIELTYHQNQDGILEYARGIRENGFPVGGVMMIDDTWQYDYGVWQFDPRAFRDPKGMMDELHSMGWKVIVWVCPYVSMDSPGYREMGFGMNDNGEKVDAGGLILERKGDPKVISWWNGKSAGVDFTSPAGRRWMARELKKLQATTGVDGFKFDGGDMPHYQAPYETFIKATPSELCEAYAKFGLDFPLNEYRACFKMAGQPLAQRLGDKDHSWNAVQMLMPHMIQAGLLGYQFVCPDMIGSGSWTAFSPSAPFPFDRELFVRSAQVHALAPMMQFSAAPWKKLKGEYLEAVRAAAWTRMKFTPYILKVAKESAASGEPMLRSMEYQFPGHGWEGVKDQFMMGEDLMVAPQVVKSAAEKKVMIPPGTWKGDDGVSMTGPAEIIVKTPLSRLPYWTRVGASFE